MACGVWRVRCAVCGVRCAVCSEVQCEIGGRWLRSGGVRRELQLWIGAGGGRCVDMTVCARMRGTCCCTVKVQFEVFTVKLCIADRAPSDLGRGDGAAAARICYQYVWRSHWSSSSVFAVHIASRARRHASHESGGVVQLEGLM